MFRLIRQPGNAGWHQDYIKTLASKHGIVEIILITPEPLMLSTLLTILLLEGFITISVEILTIRQLMPFYGNSVVITSIIIGFFL